jgi:PAS domain S-box-containing protein
MTENKREYVAIKSADTRHGHMPVEFIHPLSPDDRVAEVNTLMGELRETVARLRESERQLRLVTDNAPVGIVHCDNELRYKFINRHHAERLFHRFGLTPEQIIGKRVPEVIGDELFTVIEPYVLECLAGKAVEFDIEFPYRAWEAQFLHCRLEPEWREGKVVGLVSAGTDITSLKRAEVDLRDSKERLQLALDAARLGWWHYDPLNQVVSRDARFKEIFGVIEDKAVIEEAVKRVYVDDTERVRAAREAALNPSDPKPLAIEHRIQRGDGEVRWVEAHGLAHFEGNGRDRRAVSLVGTVQDITERKEREEKEHLLMREISHRAKNMLSVVDSIAHQTAIRAPGDFVERFSERIQALAASQDLLVRNEWNGVEIADLVRAQLAHFVDLIGSRIVVCGSSLRLNAASSQAIGLALHELATNAGKYGALSTGAGRVDIGWGTDADTFTMSWTEREGPPVSSPTQRGFGTTVMGAMTERSLDGVVDLDYPSAGLTWCLTCSAANVLESSI